MKNSRDWRPTAFVDTAPRPEGSEPDTPPEAGLSGLLRAVIVVDALAALAITLHGTPRAATSVALVAFLLSLVFAGLLQLRLLFHPPRPGDRRTASLAFALLLAGVFGTAGGWWSAGLR